MNLICQQAAITLAYGKFKCHTTVLVQKGTALDMLLGTDFLGQLGFRVLQVQDDGKGLELLSQNKQKREVKKQLHEQREEIQIQEQEKEEQIPEQEEEAQLSPEESKATVRILKAVRIPGHHCHVVGVNVETSLETSTMMFNSMDKDSEDGLICSTSVVESNSDSSLTITVKNHSGCPVFLEGHWLGTLEPVEIMPTPSTYVLCLIQTGLLMWIVRMSY